VKAAEEHGEAGEAATKLRRRRGVDAAGRRSVESGSGKATVSAIRLVAIKPSGEIKYHQIKLRAFQQY
jgi:ABC-type microcin C transport system duplicated ATPase subunit YejF